MPGQRTQFLGRQSRVERLQLQLPLARLQQCAQVPALSEQPVMQLLLRPGARTERREPSRPTMLLVLQLLKLRIVERR